MAQNIAGMGALSWLCLLAACGDPVPPAAQGAVSIHVQQYDANQYPDHKDDRCPPGRHWVDVPFQRGQGADKGTQQASDTESGPKAVNNQDGNSITCSVKASGGGFHVTADAVGYAEDATRKIKSSIVHINIGSIAPGDSNAAGTLTIQDDASLNSYTSMSCVYSVQGGSLGVDAGRIWANLKCEALADLSAPSASCQVDTGFFVFENCAR